MKNNIIKYLACAAVAAGLTLSVQATSITGGISLGGGPITVNNGNNLATATQVISFGTVITTGGSGTYSGVTIGTSVPTTAGFTFNPTLVPNPVTVWSFVFAGKTYSFDLTSIQAVSQGTDINGNKYLQISGSGTLKATGFDNTAGSYLLTANSASETFSFSSSNGTLPDGGVTAILLGAAISGLGLIRRKVV